MRNRTGKTPVNLDEIFQKPALNFFKKSTGDKEGESTHDEAPTTTAASSTAAAAATAAEKEKTKKEKEEKEKKEKKQKEEEKAKKDKADKAETEGNNKEAKSAAGLFKRAANTLLESTSKPGTTHLAASLSTVRVSCEGAYEV
jgi:FKBP-type peptidyl-prolyl cis-trans isomerase